MDPVVVDDLFVGPAFKTQVLISEEAASELGAWVESSGKDGDKYFDSLQWHAKAGFFPRYEGPREVLRYKGELGVYAFEPDGTLFRLYGNYLSANKATLVFFTAGLKKGERLRDADKSLAERARTIWEKRLWSRRTGT